MENTAQLTEAWKEALVGKTIDDVSLHMLAEHYIEYEEGRIWISDGGFEIRSGESHFSFCFHDESGNFAFHAQPLTDFMEGFDHYEVDLSESVPYLKIKDTTIIDLNVRWSGYEVHDYDGRRVNLPHIEAFVADIKAGYEKHGLEIVATYHESLDIAALGESEECGVEDASLTLRAAGFVQQAKELERKRKRQEREWNKFTPEEKASRLVLVPPSTAL